MNILAIDTSSRQGSVALGTGDGHLFSRSGEGEINYSIRLFRWLTEVREESDLVKGFMELDAVAVTSGPGSFTGLRVGVAAAKGIALTAGCRLIPIPTLEAMAWAASDCGALRRPVLLAGRSEIYTALYRCQSGKITSIESERVVKPGILLAECADENSFIFGNGTNLLLKSLDSSTSFTPRTIDFHPDLAVAMVDMIRNQKQTATDNDSHKMQIRYIRSAATLP